MSNLPAESIGHYVETVQAALNRVTSVLSQSFLTDGSFSAQGDLLMNSHSIQNATDISVGTLHYTALDPPISSGGNVSGPLSSTDNALLRYYGTTGQVVRNSSITLSDDEKLAGTGGSIAFGTAGVLDLVSASVRVNGFYALGSSETLVNDSDIPVWDTTTGKVLKTSGISIGAIAAKLPLAGGTMAGPINMGTNVITGMTTIAGTVKTSAVNDLLTSTASGVTDSEIVVFDSTTGKVAKASGVLVGAIAAKLPLAGGTMSGSINMGGFNVTNATNIAGTVKTSAVNDLLTSITGAVVAGNIPIFSGTSGRVIDDSGVLVSSVVSGPASATDNAVARFDSTTGKIVQNSTVTVSDDSKIAANGCTLDMSVGGTINLIAGGAAQVNGSSIATALTLASYVQGPASAVDGRLAAFDLATGKLIKDSGILMGDVASGPASATDNAIARFDGVTGKLVQNSAVTVSDDAKVTATGGVIDMSVSGTIDFQATNVFANGEAFLTGAILDDYAKGPVSSVNNNIASFDLATGKLLKDSGVAATSIVVGPASATDNAIARFDGTTGKLTQNSAVTVSDDAKIAANSNTVDLSVAGVLNLVSASVQANGVAVATTGTLATYVQGPASAVNDNIATYNLTTGKLVKDSGVAIGAIANKLPLAGGSMSGNINMGTNNLTNVGSIVGATNSSTVDNLVSCAAVSVVDSDVAVFNGTTGRVLKTSGINLASFAVGPGSATDNAVTRFDGTTGKLVQNSAVTISDDAKIAATGGIIDMSFLNTIDLQATNVNVNGSAIATAASLATYVQGPASSTNDNIATYNLATGKLIKDSGVAIGQIANKLPLAGGTMSGAIAMATNNITNIGSISGATKTSAVDNIVTSSVGVAVDSDIAIFDSTTGKIIKNSSVQVSTIANKLSLAGGTMSGSIAMGGFNVTNCALITFPSNNVSLGSSATGGTAIAIGLSNTASAANTIAIGTSCTASLQYAAAIGNACNSSGARALSFGGGSLGITNPQTDGIAIGSDISLGAGSNGIAIGNAASIGTVSNAIAIGTGASNSTASSCLIGNTTIANIRPNSTGTCDLGTTAARFKDVLLSGSISGATNTRTADNIVSNAGASTSGNVVTFSGTTGKIIQDSGASLANYLPLGGGTMTGPITMNNNDLINVGLITTNTTNILIGQGVTASYSNSIVIGELASSTGVGSVVVLGRGSTAADTSIAIGVNVTAGSGSTVMGYASTDLGTVNTLYGRGSNTGAGNTGVVSFGDINASTVSNAMMFGDHLTNGTANSLLLGNTNFVNIRAASTTCDLGTTLLPFQTLYLNANIAGPTNSRAADNIVSNAGASTSGNIASMSGTTGKVITDSGVAAASVVVGPASVVTGNIASYNGTTGKLVADSGVLASSVVVGPASAVTNRIAVFNGTTGKLVADGGATVASLLSLSGGTMTGTITIGANAITGTSSSTITAGVFSSLIGTNATSTSTGAIITLGGMGIGKDIFSSGAFITTDATNSTSTTTGSIRTAGGIGCVKNITSGAVVSATRFEASTPLLCKSSAVSQALTFAFTASVNTLVNITGFTKELDPASVWTLTTTTGKHTYTGATTMYFKIDIIFNIAATANNQGANIWIAKNGGAPPTAIDSTFWSNGNISTGAYQKLTTSSIYQMANGDTVQLAINYSATTSPSFNDCQYLITPVN